VNAVRYFVFVLRSIVNRSGRMYAYIRDGLVLGPVYFKRSTDKRNLSVRRVSWLSALFHTGKGKKNYLSNRGEVALTMRATDLWSEEREEKPKGTSGVMSKKLGGSKDKGGGTQIKFGQLEETPGRKSRFKELLAYTERELWEKSTSQGRILAIEIDTRKGGTS